MKQVMETLSSSLSNYIYIYIYIYMNKLATEHRKTEGLQ